MFEIYSQYTPLFFFQIFQSICPTPNFKSWILSFQMQLEWKFLHLIQISLKIVQVNAAGMKNFMLDSDFTKKCPINMQVLTAQGF